MAETGRGGAKPARSVLFLVRGRDTVPSCRFRAWQFRAPLEALGVRVTYVILEKSRNPFRQLLFHLRLIPLARSHGAVVFQKLLEPARLRFLRLWNRNLHYDFDDAMYLAPDGAKFPATVRAAPRVIAGNAILAAEARKHNPDVAIIPTVIPLPGPPSAAGPGQGGAVGPGGSGPGGPRPFVLSWIGTAPNLAYLEPLLAALDAADPAGLELRVMTDRPEAIPRRPWVTALRWSREGEEQEFRACDIGLMPMPDTPWCRGKCACKALQYLSYGKPVITSPVGVNREMFADGRFGSLAVTPGDWGRAVEAYRNDPERRRREGEAGYAFVRDGYALGPWAARLAEHLLGPA